MPGLRAHAALFEPGRERRQMIPQVVGQALVRSVHRDSHLTAAVRHAHFHAAFSGAEVQFDVANRLVRRLGWLGRRRFGSGRRWGRLGGVPREPLRAFGIRGVRHLPRRPAQVRLAGRVWRQDFDGIHLPPSILAGVGSLAGGRGHAVWWRGIHDCKSRRIVCRCPGRLGNGSGRRGDWEWIGRGNCSSWRSGGWGQRGHQGPEGKWSAGTLESTR